MKTIVLILLMAISSGSVSATPVIAASRCDQALDQLLRQQPDRGRRVKVYWPNRRVAPQLLLNVVVPVWGSTPEAQASDFIRRYAALLMVDSAALQLVGRHDIGQRRVLKYRQRVANGTVPVQDAFLALTIENRNIVAVHNMTRPVDPNLNMRPRVTSQQAIASVLQTLSTNVLWRDADVSLMISSDTPSRLVYRILLPQTADLFGRVHYVDAQDAAYLGWTPGMTHIARPAVDVFGGVQ